MKKLFYVRHGETQMNVNEKFSGQIETQLTELGKKQAQKAGENAKVNLPKIDYMIVSPLKRTRHTAKLIAEEIGFSFDAVELNDLFIERSFGNLEGSDAKPYIAKADKHMKLDHIESVETIKELEQRAKKAYEYVLSLEDYDNILIVGHGTFGRALRRVIDKRPHTDEFNVFKPIKNAEIIELI